MARVKSHTRRSERDLYIIDVDGDRVRVTAASTASVGCHPPTDTWQLCVGRHCFIFQLAHADCVPKSLRILLNHRSHTFVRFWNHSDRRKLKHLEQCLGMYRDPLDLRYFAEAGSDGGLVQDSVEEIVERCFGYVVEKRNDGLAYQFAYLNCIEKE
ncbi:uncharacterized protein LOC124819951 [Vigna umbellata]|uniref:uncharacterized protein LOC124819951 n=1 Tax=Vigna umbellata TaxID=87088 RepID=UPI001F5F2255|nr:uncharacterized protein LOC124819951 [Vigna umbellata]